MGSEISQLDCPHIQLIWSDSLWQEVGQPEGSGQKHQNGILTMRPKPYPFLHALINAHTKKGQGFEYMDVGTILTFSASGMDIRGRISPSSIKRKIKQLHFQILMFKEL